MINRVLRLESLLALRSWFRVGDPSVAVRRAGHPTARPSKAKGRAPAVTVVTRAKDEETHFWSRIKSCAKSHDFPDGPREPESSACFPCAMTFPAARRLRLRLEPQNCDQKWNTVIPFLQLGSNVAVHDDRFSTLPFAPGTKFKVTQGYNGSFSHKGSNLYAIGLADAEGTPVRRGSCGLVVKVRDDS